MKIAKRGTQLVLQLLLICSATESYSKKEESVNPHLQTILSKFESLPKQYKPTDTKHAMQLIMQGKSVWNYVASNRFYSALALHIDDPKTSNLIKNCLERSHDRFWIDIHNNQKVQQLIEQANVAFTREMSKKPEYFMFFRMTYLKTMIEKDEYLKKFETAYQQAIIALQWFLFAQAILENDIFTSAMITIPDSDMNLFYFLDGYAELISARYRFYSAISFHSLWQSNAHTQLTRHWKHKKMFKDIAFGINFNNNSKENTTLLPLNNSNLMFGILDNNLTFIKWQSSEDSLLKKSLKMMQRKKDTDTTSTLSRYDKVPQDVMLQFKSLFKHPLTRHQIHLISKDGITAMLQMLDDDVRPLFINFLQKAKNYNVFDNTMRKGNEIILNPKRFKDFYSAPKNQPLIVS